MNDGLMKKELSWDSKDFRSVSLLETTTDPVVIGSSWNCYFFMGLGFNSICVVWTRGSASGFVIFRLGKDYLVPLLIP